MVHGAVGKSRALDRSGGTPRLDAAAIQLQIVQPKITGRRIDLFAEGKPDSIITPPFPLLRRSGPEGEIETTPLFADGELLQLPIPAEPLRCGDDGQFQRHGGEGTFRFERKGVFRPRFQYNLRQDESGLFGETVRQVQREPPRTGRVRIGNRPLIPQCGIGIHPQILHTLKSNFSQFKSGVEDQIFSRKPICCDQGADQQRNRSFHQKSISYLGIQSITSFPSGEYPKTVVFFKVLTRPSLKRKLA